MIPKTSSLSIPYLDPATKVSELTQYSKELADRLEWALGVAGVSERVIAMDPVNAKLANHEKRLVTVEKKVATAESQIKAMETAQAAPTSSKPALAAQWTANGLTAIKDPRLGLVFIVLDATRSAAIPNGAELATLPAGFRPPITLSVTGTQSEGGAAGALAVVIGTDGIVKVWPGSTSNKRASVSTFWAAA
ncbi:hypothetical protein M3D15_08655 [Pseudoclavibacter alba]|uniref:Uncharacterized protein n=1 Tax=Pseudoclavibacter albus TaxID=272241 RepID=A0ABT2HYJ5_9MICO|nr:hypothetical protein [Pseudoclavibacter alba]MCT2043393.1 hypothetical protein [Pseudoclavibacter alba]